MKNKDKSFGRKRKATWYIYIPGSQYHENEGHLNLRSCLHDDVIKYPPRIGKHINEHELYRQWTPRGVKYTKINYIESYPCVINVTIMTPVLNIEREKWVAFNVLRNVNDRVYICLCSVRPEENMCKKKQAFVYNSHLKLLHQPQFLDLSLITEQMLLFLFWINMTEKHNWI